MKRRRSSGHRIVVPASLCRGEQVCDEARHNRLIGRIKSLLISDLSSNMNAPGRSLGGAWKDKHVRTPNIGCSENRRGEESHGSAIDISEDGAVVETLRWPALLLHA